MLLVYICLVWCAAILLNDTLFNSPWIESGRPVTLLYAGGLMVAMTLWLGFRHRFPKIGRRLFLLVVFLASGLWFDLRRPTIDEHHIAQNNGLYVIVQGLVNDEPVTSDFSTRFHLRAEQVQALNRISTTHGIILVILPPDATRELHYGDYVEVRGTLLTPPRLDEFSYRDYLARQGVFSQMHADILRVMDTERGHPVQHRLLDIKKRAKIFIQKTLPEPQSGLLVGILLGDETGLSPETEADFAETGTSHIIAISGFNMAIIAGLVNWFWLGILRKRGQAALLSLVIIGLYTVLVGANPAVVRAAIMAGVLVTGQALQRGSYLPTSLALTILLMTLQAPYVVYDVGFQLSVMAVLGMGGVVPYLQKAVWRGLNNLYGEERAIVFFIHWLTEPVLVTLSAQLMTAPIILYHFGQLSWVALPANFLIIPAQPMVIFLGGAGVLASFVHPGLGEIFLQAAWIFLTYSLEIVQWFADRTSSFTWHISVWGALGILGMVITLIILQATRPPWVERLRQQWRGLFLGRVRRYAPLVLGLVILGGIGQQVIRQPDRRLHVHYLDMGHSNSVLIQTPNGGVMLIDGGRFPSRLLNALGDNLPARQRQIDVLFITSDNRDDIAALAEVMHRYQVGAVVLPTGLRGEHYAEVRAVIDEQGVPVILASPHYRIRSSDGVMMELLSPLADVEEMVIRLTYGKAVFLFTASLPTWEETILLERNPHLVQATVLQAAGHASARTNSPEWVQAVNPQVVIVQTDPSSQTDVTDGASLANFTDRKLYRTDQNGAIEIITDGKTLEVVLARPGD